MCLIDPLKCFKLHYSCKTPIFLYYWACFLNQNRSRRSRCLFFLGLERNQHLLGRILLWSGRDETLVVNRPLASVIQTLLKPCCGVCRNHFHLCARRLVSNHFFFVPASPNVLCAAGIITPPSQKYIQPVGFLSDESTRFCYPPSEHISFILLRWR